MQTICVICFDYTLRVVNSDSRGGGGPELGEGFVDRVYFFTCVEKVLHINKLLTFNETLIKSRGLKVINTCVDKMLVTFFKKLENLIFFYYLADNVKYLK